MSTYMQLCHMTILSTSMLTYFPQALVSYNGPPFTNSACDIFP